MNDLSNDWQVADNGDEPMSNNSSNPEFATVLEKRLSRW